VPDRMGQIEHAIEGGPFNENHVGHAVLTRKGVPLFGPQQKKGFDPFGREWITYCFRLSQLYASPFPSPVLDCTDGRCAIGHIRNLGSQRLKRENP